MQITYLDSENALRTLNFFRAVFRSTVRWRATTTRTKTLESVLLVTGVQLEPVASEQSQKPLFGAGLLAQCMVRTAASADAL